jgi:hypothetical protein
MDPMATEVTIQILKSIRDEVKQTNARLDTLRNELSQRIVESELRTATAITELAGTVREMTSVLRQQSDLRPRVEKCEEQIRELKSRVG